ncbi:MAG: M55 family metallopeptidase [Lentisphaerae bacterium]|nr:M55 family metallopeptidase [Lentisphaerota bacterium]MBT4815027.1 M55 family metallopeptidase [Lentisphaerota bacterium]MBT5609006.1 M55 family metallopeptidase [Lentisphaerota bacterium]MBT7055817.1 M55 family metallopeptidase [Lentisphaerota bacterium]MBT7843378.1 M55 family metallopeptidase [Lentisphaerota bacterium]
MNIYIFVDMEGISGVSGSEFVTAAGKLYQTGRQYYTQDVNVCARACFDAGASAVIARDGHGGGNHMLWDQLDPRIELVQGPTGAVRMAGLEECDALILLGYHAMAGTPGALLEHSYSSKAVQNMWLNGRPVGEIGIDAAIAGDYGVPTIMVSGDNYACAEAENWIPGVVPCVVKTGLGCQAARLLPMEKAHQLIRQQTTAAVAQLGTIEPLVVDRPATVRREMVERLPVPSARPGVTIVDGRTYEVSGDTVERAFFATV